MNERMTDIGVAPLNSCSCYIIWTINFKTHKISGTEMIRRFSGYR